MACANCSLFRSMLHLMSQLRDDFQSFLLRIGNNEMRATDWHDFAVQQYADEEVESLRGKLLAEFSAHDWQVGWVPRRLQDIARVLAEYLREHSDDSTTYWPEWSRFNDDGTLILKVTWADDESLTTGVCEIAPTAPNYGFWCWVVNDPKWRGGLKRAREIAMLREEYENRP